MDDIVTSCKELALYSLLLSAYLYLITDWAKAALMLQLCCSRWSVPFDWDAHLSYVLGTKTTHCTQVIATFIVD